MEIVPSVPNGAARWTQRTTIDGRDYSLTFRWNQRDGKWSLDLADQDGVAIRSGLPLTTDQFLLRGVIDERRPAGDLLVIDTQGLAEDPDFASLGTRHLLVYVESA